VAISSVSFGATVYGGSGGQPMTGTPVAPNYQMVAPGGAGGALGSLVGASGIILAGKPGQPGMGLSQIPDESGTGSPSVCVAGAGGGSGGAGTTLSGTTPSRTEGFNTGTGPGGGGSGSCSIGIGVYIPGGAGQYGQVTIVEYTG